MAAGRRPRGRCRRPPARRGTSPGPRWPRGCAGGGPRRAARRRTRCRRSGGRSGPGRRRWGAAARQVPAWVSPTRTASQGSQSPCRSRERRVRGQGGAPHGGDDDAQEGGLHGYIAVTSTSTAQPSNDPPAVSTTAGRRLPPKTLVSLAAPPRVVIAIDGGGNALRARGGHVGVQGVLRPVQVGRVDEDPALEDGAPGAVQGLVVGPADGPVDEKAGGSGLGCISA